MGQRTSARKKSNGKSRKLDSAGNHWAARLQNGVQNAPNTFHAADHGDRLSVWRTWVSQGSTGRETCLYTHKSTCHERPKCEWCDHQDDKRDTTCSTRSWRSASSRDPDSAWPVARTDLTLSKKYLLLDFEGQVRSVEREPVGLASVFSYSGVSMPSRLVPKAQCKEGVDMTHQHPTTDRHVEQSPFPFVHFACPR